MAALLFGATVLAVSSTSDAVLTAGASTTKQSSVVRTSKNWASFGNGPEHDFTTRTSITAANVGTLDRKSVV